MGKSLRIDENLKNVFSAHLNFAFVKSFVFNPWWAQTTMANLRSIASENISVKFPWHLLVCPGRVARAGRTGSAYSIVSPDELAFVIDLYLFLGRSVEFVKPDQAYQGEMSALFGRSVSQTSCLCFYSQQERNWETKTCSWRQAGM